MDASISTQKSPEVTSAAEEHSHPNWPARAKLDLGTRRPIMKLRGRAEYRLRVGDWCVLLRLDGDERTVYLLRVLPLGRA